MTDNEIVKSLEICTSEGTKCGNCPYFCDGCVEDGYRSKPMRDALDLIKRQKAEIERLKEENKFHRKTITENAQRALEVTIEEIENAKSEAYREFAEKVKAKADRGFWQEHSYVDTEDIDNTLKELTRNLHGTCTEK